VVEYMNAFCAHCRATHARLDRILHSYPVPVREQRIYVWGGGPAPLWAKACVCARAQGKEEPFFAQLLRAGSDTPNEVWAAAQRAGLDVQALTAAVERGDATERLERYRRRFQASRLEGLPTIDVGRRRLQGEQSDGELREALDAAAALLPR
jgi:predicted DsbA family dithiol-disulfide isomerase